MKKKRVLLIVLAVLLIAGAGFLGGSYFMYKKITNSENYARQVAEKTIDSLNNINGTAFSYYSIPEYSTFCWKFKIALFEPGKLKELQKTKGQSFGENFYNTQKNIEDYIAKIRKL